MRTRLLLSMLAASVASTASAQVPVIPPGREAEIQALFAPHALGAEVRPGWTLHAIRIEGGTIRVQLRAEAATALVALNHPEHGPPGARPIGSFAVSEEGPPESAPARAAILEALGANDAGAFWGDAPLLAESATPRGGEGEPAAAAPSPAHRTSPAWPVLLALGALLASVGGFFAIRRARRGSGSRGDQV